MAVGRRSVLIARSARPSCARPSLARCARVIASGTERPLSTPTAPESGAVARGPTPHAGGVAAGPPSYAGPESIPGLGPSPQRTWTVRLVVAAVVALGVGVALSVAFAR